MSTTRSTQIVVTILVVSLALTACGSSAPAVTEASAPTKAAVESTAAPTDAPTEQAAIEPTATTAAAIEPPAAAAVSFANDILPILESRCLNCHGGRETKEGLSVASYGALMAGSDNGPVIVAGDAENSLLVQQLLNGKMPKRGPKLTPDQVQLIVDWVSAGAMNN
ncbi:MAG: c-type cytochrome domain-containing protein [Chloroflexota bacterium]